MKVLFCFAFVVAAAYGASVTPLGQDLNDFKALIPTAEIVVIAGEHLLFDSQFRKAKDFLESAEFNTYWKQAIESPEFYDILTYVAASGADAVTAINSIAKKLKLSDYTGTAPAVSQRSVSSFVTSVFNAFSKSKVQALINSKLQSSPQFKYFYDRMTAPAFSTLVQNFLNAPQLATGWAAVKAHGINPQEIITLFKGVIGL